MRRERYVVGDRPQVEVTVKSGDIRLLSGTRGEIAVELAGAVKALDAIEVIHAGDRVTVRDRSGLAGWRARGVDVTVTVPDGTRAALRAGSGDISASVILADVSAELASGGLRLDEATGDLEVDCASGDISISSVGGDVAINTASGDIRLGEATGRIVINSASGDVNLGRLAGSLKVATASGDVHVRAFGGSELSGQSMSGDFRIGLESGLAVDADVHTLSGSIRNEIPESADAPRANVALRIKTFSGDIVFRPAP